MKFKECRFALWVSILLVTMIILFVPVKNAKAQEPVPLFTPNSPIPKKFYKSWSLFLITSLEWVLPESNDKLKNLYDVFQAFGRAIGPDHVAVWFWSKDPNLERYYKAVDVMRSAAFCTKLKLLPSKGPYILVTTEYPGPSILRSYPETFPNELKNFQVIDLNNVTASEVIRLLNDLADKLMTSDISEIDPYSEEYWRKWQRSFEAAKNTIITLSKKVTLKIKTVFFEVDIIF